MTAPSMPPTENSDTSSAEGLLDLFEAAPAGAASTSASAADADSQPAGGLLAALGVAAGEQAPAPEPAGGLLAALGVSADEDPRDAAVPAAGTLESGINPAPTPAGGLLAALEDEGPSGASESAATAEDETYLSFPPPDPAMAPVADADTPAPVPSAGLGELFAASSIAPSPGEAEPAAAAPTPGADVESAVAESVAAGGGLADLFAGGDPQAAAVPSQSGDGTVAPAPAPAPAPSRAPEAPVAGTSGTPSEIVPATQRSTPYRQGAVERSQRSPARSRKGAAGKAIAEVRDMRTRDPRYTNPEIWGYADRILRYMQQDQDLQDFLDDLQLTRDTHLDRRQRQQLEALVAPKLVHSDVRILNPHDLPHVWDTVYDELIGLGPLAEFWRDDEVTEIMVDAWDRIVIERDGRLVPTVASFRSAEHATDVARALARKVSGRALSRAIPIVTAELPGARVQFFLGDIARTGLSITMRKFRPLLGMEQLLEIGALSEEMADFLADCVAARATVLISGGTGTGKTTMINALSEFIPETERVITIEESFELQLTNDLVVSFQTKEAASQDDEIRVGQDDLLIGSLRARPDRIIVGEIRDEKGAAVMLQAANTGHDGTMTTIHANNPYAALNFRLAAMLMRSGMPDVSAKTEIATALDLVVQVTRKGRKRFISAISLVDVEQMHNGMLLPEKVFEGSVEGGVVQFRRVGGVRPDTEFADKLEEADIDISRWEKP